jgi:uncharacterized membrane protein YkvA (DUF1232 family)
MQNFLSQIKRFVGYVPFVRDAVAMYFCAMDSNTPIHVKGTILAALGYFLSPADAIPDVITGLGFTDDAAVISGTLATISVYITKEHWQKADTFFD